MNRLIIAAYFVTTVFFSGCTLFSESPDDTDYSNLWDPNSPTYIPPSTVIDEGASSVETTHTITFRWHSTRQDYNAYDTTEYRNIKWSYRLNDAEYSEVSGARKITYTLLSDTLNVFEIKTYYPSGAVEDPPTQVIFRVDEVDGSSLMFYPRKTDDAEVGEKIIIDVIAEEVLNLTGSRISFNYNPSALRIDAIYAPPDTSFILLKRGGSALFMPPDVNDITGEVEIYTAVAGAAPYSVDGTGPIARIELTPLAVGETTLEFSSACIYRNAANEDIPIARKVPGVIIVR